MQTMTSRERMTKVIAGGKADIIPFCDYMDAGIEEKLREYYGFKPGDYGFWKAIGMDAVQFMEYAAPIFIGDPNLENPNIHTDSSYTEAHGEEGNTESFIEEGAIHTKEHLKFMEFPDLDAPGYFDFAKEYIDECHKHDLATCFALRTMPVYTTVFTMGIQEFSYAMYDDVELIEEIITRYNDWNIKLVDKLEALGMDTIIACNDMAFNSGPLMSPTKFNEIFYPKMMEVKEKTNVPWCHHSDGNMIPVFDEIMSLTQCINPIDPNCMDIYEIKKKYGEKITPWGNLDVNLLTRGTKQEVEDETKRLLTEIGADGHYIFGSGNSIPYYSNLENVITMFETYKKFVGK